MLRDLGSRLSKINQRKGKFRLSQSISFKSRSLPDSLLFHLQQSYGGYSILVALCISFLSSIASGSSASHLSQSGFAPLLLHDDPDMPASLLRARPHDLASPSTLRAQSLQVEASAAAYSPMGVVLGHVYLMIYAFLTLEKERATVVAAKETGGRRRALVLACVMTAGVAVPFGIFGKMIVSERAWRFL